jgi:hypothetical protein
VFFNVKVSTYKFWCKIFDVMSLSYWSPVEKLILHLSPVSRRRAAKNQNGATSPGSNTRNRSRSEPNGRRRSRILYSTPSITCQSSKTSLVNDIKALRWFCINAVGPLISRALIFETYEWHDNPQGGGHILLHVLLLDFGFVTMLLTGALFIKLIYALPA